MTLFDVEPAGRVRATDPITSVLAARAQRGGAKRAILALYDRPGRTFTWSELAHRLSAQGFYGDTVRSAVAQLHKDGHLVPSGEVRKTARGRDAICWRLSVEYPEQVA